MNVGDGVRRAWMRSVPIEAAGLALGGGVLFVLGSQSGGSTLSLLTSAAIFGVAATGLGFLWGQSGQVNLGHAALFGAGAYCAALLSSNLQLGFYVSLPLSALAGATLAGLMALASLRVGGHYFVILTFALGEVVVTIANRLTGLTGGLSGFTLVSDFTPFSGAGGLSLELGFYAVCLIILVLTLLVVRLAGRSSWGTTLRGIRDNAPLARSLGRDDAVHKVLAFLVSGAVAGIGGQLYVYQVQYIAPHLFGVELGLIFLVMVLLGGRMTIAGPVVGALIYEFLPNVTTGSPLVTQMILGIVLIVLILFLPDGVIPGVGRSLRAVLPGMDRARHAPRGALASPDAPASIGAGGSGSST